MQKALLQALLKPWDRLRAAEDALDFTGRFVVTEELKNLPYGAVWTEFCSRHDLPSGAELISDLTAYEASVSGR